MTLKATILKLYHNEVIRYLVAGGYNTVFGFLAFAGLYLLLEDFLHYLIIAVIYASAGVLAWGIFWFISGVVDNVKRSSQ